MKKLCFSVYNVNILQLNVAMWGPSCFRTPVVVNSYAPVAYLTYMFQLEISELQ